MIDGRRSRASCKPSAHGECWSRKAPNTPHNKNMRTKNLLVLDSDRPDDFTNRGLLA
jgi:hypothetical protein